MPSFRRSLLRQVIPLGVIAVVLAVVAGIVWGTGGFEKAPASMGALKPAGHTFQSKRWNLTFQEARIELNIYDEPELVIVGVGTLLDDEPAPGPAEQVVQVRLPDGTTVTDLTWLGDIGFGQPEVTAPVEISIDLAELPPGDAALQVGVYDEQKVDSFISDERWTATAALGHVELLATDMR